MHAGSHACWLYVNCLLKRAPRILATLGPRVIAQPKHRYGHRSTEAPPWTSQQTSESQRATSSDNVATTTIAFATNYTALIWLNSRSHTQQTSPAEPSAATYDNLNASPDRESGLLEVIKTLSGPLLS